MKPRYKKQIKEILRNFDFEYVCTAMMKEKSKWGYGANDEPQEDLLKDLARELLKDAIRDPQEFISVRSHGLMALKEDNCLSLYFVTILWTEIS